MYKLGYYYENIEKNYDEAKKYYLMAIDKGNSNVCIIWVIIMKI
jgi:TPR repeat protein